MEEPERHTGATTTATPQSTNDPATATIQHNTGTQSILPPRPPKTWRERIFHSLPFYTGPYNVGYLEVELPVDQPRAFSQIKRNHEHALQLDTVLFSIYYPSNVDPTTGARVPWLPRPRVPTWYVRHRPALQKSAPIRDLELFREVSAWWR